MACPKSVVKFTKNGITYTDSVDRANYLITELTRAAMKDVAKYVSDKHRKFLHTKELRTAFCKSLDSLNDNAFAYTVSEYLIQKSAMWTVIM